jgi:pilus assembly protein CpaF
VQVRPIWRWEQTGVSNGAVQGRFVTTGYVPQCLEQLESYGIAIDRRDFEPAAEAV